MNEVDGWIYFDGPQPGWIQEMFDALRAVRPATAADAEAVSRRFWERFGGMRDGEERDGEEDEREGEEEGDEGGQLGEGAAGDEGGAAGDEGGAAGDEASAEGDVARAAGDVATTKRAGVGEQAAAGIAPAGAVNGDAVVPTTTPSFTYPAEVEAIMAALPPLSLKPNKRPRNGATKAPAVTSDYVKTPPYGDAVTEAVAALPVAGDTAGRGRGVRRRSRSSPSSSTRRTEPR